MVASLLIVGGTGLVGSAIIREAQIHHQTPSLFNRHIFALSRSAHRQKSVTSGVTFVAGNALDPSSFESSLDGNPDVVHTVGTLLDQSKKHGAQGTYDSLNRDAAISVAEALAQKYDGIHRRCFVYFSAAHAPPKFLLNERYIQAKREAEHILLNRVEFKEKLRVVVLRPGFIYSYHRRQIMLPFVLGLIVGSAILKPLTSYVPDEALYLTDRPISDSEIAHAVFEVLEDGRTEGICDIDKIRQLAKQWENKKIA